MKYSDKHLALEIFYKPKRNFKVSLSFMDNIIVAVVRVSNALTCEEERNIAFKINDILSYEIKFRTVIGDVKFCQTTNEFKL